MNARRPPDKANAGRRRFLGQAAVSVSAMGLGLGANAQAARGRDTAAGAIATPIAAPFGPVRQVDAGDLSIGYVELGPASGPPVLLLHGWPYDIHSYAEVAPLLAAQGHRVIVPFLRGHGTTRFLSSDTARNGQPAALALDTIALMDALRIDKAAFLRMCVSNVFVGLTVADLADRQLGDLQAG